jgi:hypothetical protein
VVGDWVMPGCERHVGVGGAWASPLWWKAKGVVWKRGLSLISRGESSGNMCGFGCVRLGYLGLG